jgi:hypothetical protein
VKKSGRELPTWRESKRRRKAQATIKYSLMAELGYGTIQMWNLTIMNRLWDSSFEHRYLKYKATSLRKSN